MLLNFLEVQLHILGEHGLFVHPLCINPVHLDALFSESSGHVPFPLFTLEMHDSLDALLLPVLRGSHFLLLDSSASRERVVPVHEVHEALAEMRAFLIDEHRGLPYRLLGSFTLVHLPVVVG